jgi:hypothetical protein
MGWDETNALSIVYVCCYAYAMLCHGFAGITYKVLITITTT